MIKTGQIKMKYSKDGFKKMLGRVQTGPPKVDGQSDRTQVMNQHRSIWVYVIGDQKTMPGDVLL